MRLSHQHFVSLFSNFLSFWVYFHVSFGLFLINSSCLWSLFVFLVVFSLELCRYCCSVCYQVVFLTFPNFPYFNQFLSLSQRLTIMATDLMSLIWIIFVAAMYYSFSTDKQYCHIVDEGIMLENAFTSWVIWEGGDKQYFVIYVRVLKWYRNNSII